MPTPGIHTTNVLRRAAAILKLRPHLRTMASEGKSEAKKDFTPGADPSSRLIWVDLELTGLDPRTDFILEAACTITEANLEIVATCPDLVIHQPESVLDRMVPWCQDNHRKSGLITEVQNSTLTIEKAEEKLLQFVRQHTQKGACPLAGNTVYMDRIFLKNHMPTFDDHMHYRIVDVSAIKEVCRRWCREVYVNAPEKKFIHRAGVDISESIEELKYYKKAIFDPKCD